MQGGTIQLLPETRRKLDIKIPGENRPLYLGLAVLGLVILVFAGLKVYASILTNSLVSLNNQALELEKKRDRDFEKNLLVLKKRFSSAQTLVANHIVWSNALTKIQSLTPPQSQMDTFFADTQATKIELKGRAPSYTVVAQQIASFLSDGAITDIDLNKVTSLSTGLLEYEMKIIFDKDKLLLNKESK